MDETYKWTCDVELDQGGRTESQEGIFKGLPIILDLFKRYNIKALFFISTELLEDFTGQITPASRVLQRIMTDGHEVGSHGHFHIKYPTMQRLIEDKRLSEDILRKRGVENPQYRAPKFDKRTWNWSPPYSDPTNHVSLLKLNNLKLKLKSQIVYLHPFDIVEAKNPPNLFCRLWYSRPRKALQLFENLLKKYPGEHRLI